MSEQGEVSFSDSAAGRNRKRGSGSAGVGGGAVQEHAWNVPATTTEVKGQESLATILFSPPMHPGEKKKVSDF